MLSQMAQLLKDVLPSEALSYKLQQMWGTVL